ncbi:hypothetical protein OKW38_002952 [Paraburkholderia sp. MM5496-R1]|uniref:hypothetical protein n=1 Tax=unclassified Paraburkholderia TaxID=2615204 RepID=UPI003D249A87
MSELSQAVLGGDLKRVIDAWAEVETILAIDRQGAANVVQRISADLDLKLYLDSEDFPGLWFPLSKAENRDQMMASLVMSGYASNMECDPGGWTNWRILPSDYGRIIEQVQRIASGGKTAIPDWMLRYKGRHDISLHDAAHILAGIPPLTDWNELPREIYGCIIEWRGALIDAINHVEINASSWSAHQDSEQMLPHADIRAWCDRRQHTWPIPDPSPQPRNDAERLMERMRSAEAERDDLARQLQTAHAEIARLKSLEEMQGYRDMTHDRFAPKLAAAIDAWEAVTDPQGKHPKQALTQWLTTNAAALGLWDKNGPNKTAIEEAAKVANWKERGGAPKTPGK